MSRRLMYEDFKEIVDNVTKEVDKKTSVQPKCPLCPRVIISAFAVSISSLIDTGSQITAMSEIFYGYLKKYNKIMELPVSNVLLFTAIGKKAAHVKKQILCEIKVGNFQCNSSFLIVPHLSNPVILGNDWLLENRAIVNY